MATITTPTPTSGWSHGSSQIIRGTGFGTKSTAKPQCWADFETSLNPTNLGVLTSWSANQNVTRHSDSATITPGTYTAGGDYPDDPVGNFGWTLGLDYNYWANDGPTYVYIYRLLRRNWIWSGQNLKVWRQWPGSETYPNIYMGVGAGNVEGTNTVFWYGGDVGIAHDTDWHIEEILFRASSAINQNDAVAELRRDGVQQVYAGPDAYYKLITRSTEFPSPMARTYPLHDFFANYAGPGTERPWYDDIYVDTTWQRVMLGNANTLAGCTLLSPQIPSAWTTTSITVTVNTGTLHDLSSGYLYVFDETGTPNTAGWPVSFTGGSTPPTGTPVLSVR